MTKTHLTTLVLLLVSTAAQATYRTVYADSSYEYTSIQAAIDDSAPGDTVYVGPGEYVEDLVFGQDLVLIGSGWDFGGPFGGTCIIGDHVASSMVRVSSTRFDVGLSCAFNVYSGLVMEACRVVVPLSSQYGIKIHGAPIIQLRSCFLSTEGNYAKAVGASSSGDSWGNTIVINCKFYASGFYCDAFYSGSSVLNTYNCVFDDIGVQHDQLTSYQNVFIGCSVPHENHPNVHHRYCASTNGWEVPHPSNIVITSADYDDDYHPTVGSPLIDAGDPSGLRDVDGSIADIGCYGGPTPCNDNCVADWLPFLTSLWITTPLVGEGDDLYLESTGEIGPTWEGPEGSRSAGSSSSDRQDRGIGR